MLESCLPKCPHLRRNLLLLIMSAFVATGVVSLAWQINHDPEFYKGLLSEVYAFLRANPWALVLALATLPGIGFPISPLFLMVGAVLGPKYGLPLACLIAIAAQSTCTIWTYLLAAGPIKKQLQNYLAKKRVVPEFSDSHALRFALIMRITPGIPYALQNVVLGIIGLKLKIYLLVSIPITALWTVGFVTTGGAIHKGSIGLTITGILLIVILVLVTRMLRQKKRNHAR